MAALEGPGGAEGSYEGQSPLSGVGIVECELRFFTEDDTVGVYRSRGRVVHNNSPPLPEPSPVGILAGSCFLFYAIGLRSVFQTIILKRKCGI